MFFWTTVVVAMLGGCAGESSNIPGGSSSEGEEQEKPAATEPSKLETRMKPPGTAAATEADVKDPEEESLSVRDAVGQMFVVGMSGTEPDYYIEKMVRQRNVGSVLLFGYNMRSLAQTRALVSSLQRLSLETEPAIPLLVAVDQEGGEVASVPWIPAQPPASALGDRGDSREVHDVYESIGRGLRAAGINTDFAPVVDTGSGAAIGSRSFGSDPGLVSRMGTAAVKGLQDAGVVSAAKHFPNHGPATADSHLTLPVVGHDLDTVQSLDLPPFRAAAAAGVPMVMVGHLVYPAIDPERPASLSPAAIRLLREDVGFDGVVVTDDLNMRGASGGPSGVPGAAVAAVRAGADLMIVSGTPQELADAYEAVVAAVESGAISRQRIDDSVERITQIKESYPLYEADAP